MSIPNTSAGGKKTYSAEVGWSTTGVLGSLVTMGFKSVPFLRFFPPVPLAAEAATLAICFPLLRTAFVMSTPSIVFGGGRGSDRRRRGSVEF